MVEPQHPRDVAIVLRNVADADRSVDDDRPYRGDDDPGDLPELPDLPGDEDTGDAPDGTEDDPVLASASGEDDEDGDDTAFDETFNAEAECGTTKLKVGATVHKAKVSRSASGKTLVSVALLGTRR